MSQHRLDPTKCRSLNCVAAALRNSAYRGRTLWSCEIIVVNFRRHLSGCCGAYPHRNVGMQEGLQGREIEIVLQRQKYAMVASGCVCVSSLFLADLGSGAEPHRALTALTLTAWFRVEGDNLEIVSTQPSPGFLRHLVILSNSCLFSGAGAQDWLWTPRRPCGEPLLVSRHVAHCLLVILGRCSFSFNIHVQARAW